MEAVDAIIDRFAQKCRPKPPRPLPATEMVGKAAESMAGAGFLPYDRAGFRRLAEYMAGEYSERHGGRGLVLSGPVGCGKTLFLARVLKVPAPPTAAGLVTIYQVQEGYNAAFWYQAFGVYECEVRGVAVDDIGQEPVCMHYGQREEVLDRVVCEGYTAWQAGKGKSFFTTNLNPDQLDKRYGRRVTDRLREMCVLVELKGGSNRGMAGADDRGALRRQEA